MANRNYFFGIWWFILSLVSSVLNDAITKHLGVRLHSFEVVFLRFGFGALTLIPFILANGLETLKSSRPLVHLVRGCLLFGGMAAWTCGLTLAPISTVTVISFSIPLFTLVLAKIFLSENIIWQRWIATLAGFTGVIVVLGQLPAFTYGAAIFIAASLGFASLDIINKKFIIKESMISMLFYSALVTAMLALPFALCHWQTPTTLELLLCLTLGASANLILFFILKAFTLVDATAVGPYRYLELGISSIVGYVLFNEIPNKHTLYGLMIIIPSTLFVFYFENKEKSQ